MANTCGNLSQSALQEWEAESVARQNTVIEQRLEKEAQRAKWRAENPDKVITAPVDPGR